MKHSKFKVYYYYHNINLWKFKSINKLNKKKWVLLKNKSYVTSINKIPYSIGKYVCHYKKLNITRLYYFKFINKQILKKYLVNYKEYNLKKKFISHIYDLERRLDFNLYKTNFVTSLYESKFFITKGFIFVNKKRVTNSNYLLNTGDLVELSPFLYNYIIKNKVFNQYLYLRNLEIDYKTLSFIFLNKSNFFIFNYNNFIKKIYFQQNNKNINNNLNIYNNFYKFFNNIFINYLFLDKQKKILNKNSKYINTYKTNILLKFIKYKYNDYYFRNILLKNTFNLKYNYLQFLIKNNIFNYNIINIDYMYKNLFNIENKINKISLNNQFFNYYYILIFNYYTNISKIIDKIQFYNNNNIFSILNNHFSINNYNYLLLFNYKIFKILHIKNKLNKYYNNLILGSKPKINFNNIKQINKNNNEIIKKINYKTISQYSNIKFHYNSIKNYNNLIYYISSYKFGYRIHKRSRNFYQNYMKRIKIIRKIRKSFYYTRFNCIRYGSFIKKITKRNLYNQLKTNNIIINSTNIFQLKNINKLQLKKIIKQNNLINNNKQSSIIIMKLSSPYYPKNSETYKFIYSSLNSNLKNNSIIFQNNIKKLNSIINVFKELNIVDNNINLKNYLYKLEKQLYFKLRIIQNSLKNDNNINKNFKDLYFLYNLIKYYNINNNFKNNKIILTTLNSIILFKIHNKINLNYNQISKNKNKKYYLKKYKYLINDYKRVQLDSYYIEYNKNKLITSSNIKSYFNKNIIKNNNLKLFYNYYFCNIKFNFFNTSIKNIYIKNKRNNLRIKYTKKYSNIFKSKYLLKHQNNINIYTKYNNNINYLNMNIINLNNNNFIFNNKLFYIDLILNLTIRKFNNNYNNFNYYNYYSKIKSLVINNFIDYKNIIIKNNLKKNKKLKKKYIYKNFIIKNCTKIYEYNYYKNYNFKIFHKLKKNYIINTNNLYYNYNKIYNNYLINNQLFNYYYGYYHYKFNNKKNTKIFIKFNKSMYLNNIYKLYLYYIFNIKKYNLIKYLFNNYILKEYTCFLNKILSISNIKQVNNNYIKQLFYNILFTKLFNVNKFDYILKNNFNYSKNLRIIINYFIIINRLYK